MSICINQNYRKFFSLRTVRNEDGACSLFSQEFKQSGAVRIADLSSYNPILPNPERSAVQLSIEVRKHRLMVGYKTQVELDIKRKSN